MLRNTVVSIAILFSAETQVLAQAQPAPAGTYTPGPDLGGRLGITTDETLHACGSRSCVMVQALNGTAFSGLQPGDYIVAVQNITFSDLASFHALIAEHAAGSMVTIEYLDAANNLADMTQTAALLGEQQDAAAAQTQQPSSSTDSNTDLAAQLEAIVSADASHWKADTYHPNSLHNIRVVERASDGSSATVRADYVYDGVLSSNWDGSVDITIRNDSTVCLKYSDEDGPCRPPYTEDQSIAPYVLAGVLGVAALGVVSSMASHSSTPASAATGSTLPTAQIIGQYAGCEMNRRYALSNGQTLVCQGYSYGSVYGPTVTQTDGGLTVNGLSVPAYVQ